MTRFASLFVLSASGLVLSARASFGGGDAARKSPSVPVVEVTARSLNVRAEPSTSGAIVASLPQGRRVRAPKAQSDGWLFVEVDDGLSGYVAARYTRAVADAPAAAEAPPEEPPANAPRPGTPLARIEEGMSDGQVREILGEPTSQQEYVTGKGWIPYHYGTDTRRVDYKYKGVGRVVSGRNRYSGAAKVIRVDADSSKDGY